VILNGSPFRQYRISKGQPFEIVQERVPTILALFKERWEALGNDKTQAAVVKNGVPLPLGNDAEMQAIIKARGAVEEVIRDRTNALNNARQEWQSRQGIWSQKNQIANRARADVNRTRGQARSKSQQAAGLERSLSQASRDLDDKLKRAKAAKESLERDRAELGRIRDNPAAKRSLESKVRNADRARQNADRAVRQSKSNHSRYLGRLKSAQNAQRSAADLAKKMVEKEVKMRRDAEEATRDRDKARGAFDQAAANLKEVSQ
jgi:chromosome segregation ATPase